MVVSAEEAEGVLRYNIEVFRLKKEGLRLLC